MTVHHRKIKQIQLAIDGVNYECQIQTWNLDPGVGEGERMYAQCPDGEFVEEPEAEGTLEVTFWADWRSGGISDFLWTNSGKIAAFTLDHHPDIPEEHVQWNGKLRVVAPPTGGEARTTETHELTFQVIGDVTDGYGRVAA